MGFEVNYLVQFGRSAYVGRFSGNANEPVLDSGEVVLIRSIRGVELGTILCESVDRFADAFNETTRGEILRIATVDDKQEQEKRQLKAKDLLTIAEMRNSYPLLFADSEATSEFILFHVVPFEECDISPLLHQLSEEHHVMIAVVDLSLAKKTPDAPDANDSIVGCGKPNCGKTSEGDSAEASGEKSGCGGCSSGGCSRGSVKSAEELTGYFKDLRSKMEAESVQNNRVSLK